MIRYEIPTSLPPEEVLDRARSFFAHAGTPYAAFPYQTQPGYLKLHIEVGEIVIGTSRVEDTTWVQGTASRGAHLLTRFLVTLGSPAQLRQATHRYRVHETVGPSTVEADRGYLPASGTAARAA